MNETWWVQANNLDEDQKAIYTLSMKDSYLIIGPPGSGKTNLLLLRAKYLITSHIHNISILVFNRTLKQFLSSGSHKYNFGDVLIQTIHKLIYDTLLEYGQEPDNSGSFEENRESNAKMLEKILKEKNISDLYEVLLIDEAQDCLPIEIRIIKRISKKIFAVADSRQKIYTGEDPMTALKKNVIEKKLLYHYRNGKKICKLADGIAKDTTDYENLMVTSHYKEDVNPSKVTVEKYSNLENQLLKVENQLTLQLKTYPDEYLGVICPTKNDLAETIEFFQNSRIKDKITNISPESGYIEFDLEKPIIICNIHNSKGLEFRAVHIVGFDSMKNYKKNNRKLSYTAVTRAKTSLSIYHCGYFLYPYFKAAYENLDPKFYVPSEQDIFGIK